MMAESKQRRVLLPRPYAHQEEVLDHAGPRTERWAANADNRVIDRGGSVSGSFQDIIIFEDGTQVECCDWETEMPTWTAGYGIDPNTWAMSDNYLQIELAQGTVDEPFDGRCIDSAAQLVAELARRYSFPIQRIPYVDQLGTPPAGITSHEDCANGRYYKKSDPGPLFPWSVFLQKATVYYNGGGTQTEPVTRREFEEYKAHTDKWLNELHQRAFNEVGADIGRLDQRLVTQQGIDADWRQQHDKLHKGGQVLP